LVTGGLGFVGSNFILHTLERGPFDVVNLDVVSYGAMPQNLSEVETDTDL
jgi:dTDP-glucose 4,6-dehydratase